MSNGQQFNRKILSNNILTQKWPTQSNTVFYVGLYKQSETGLLYNERMVVIQDRKYTLFYSKYFKPIQLLLQLENKGTSTIKQKILILGVTLNQQDNIITLNYFNQQNQKKSWTFKFITTDLASKWIHLFHQLQQKCLAKSYKTKQTKSTNHISDFTSLLTRIQYSSELPKIENKQEYQQQIIQKQQNISHEKQQQQEIS